LQLTPAGIPVRHVELLAVGEEELTGVEEGR
jgi:hypothetical protein